MIKTLSKFNKFEELKKECQELMSRVPFKDDVTQISLQVKNPDQIDWYGSCGSIFKPDNKIIVEEHYKFINPELSGSVIEEWINSLGIPVFRTRLLYVPARKCYSVHKDPAPRIHIPIITDPDCYMCFPKLGIMKHLPATGESYWVDTTLKHTFVNCSTIDRIHLVAATKLRLDVV